MTVNDLRKAVRAVGGEIEAASGGRWTRYQVHAPEGQVWSDLGVSLFPVEWCDSTFRSEAIRSAIQDISGGVREPLPHEIDE